MNKAEIISMLKDLEAAWAVEDSTYSYMGQEAYERAVHRDEAIQDCAATIKWLIERIEA